MRKTYTWTTFITAAILSLCGSAWARQEISLNGQWEMQYSHNGDQVPDGQWEKMAVPSHVSQREEQYAWYRRNFTVPETMAGQRIFLEFGGVKFVSQVYVNGVIVGDQMLQQSGWETLTFKAFVDAGVHRASLAFTNDYWDPPEDRNLDVRWLRIE